MNKKQSKTGEGEKQPDHGSHMANDGSSDASDQARGDAEKLLEQTSNRVIGKAREMLESPDLVNLILEDIERMGVAGEETLSLLTYLVGTSRLLNDPLALLVQGQSSGGKSYVVDAVASLFPPEAMLRATQMTTHALFHMPKGSLKHRWVICGERSRKVDDDTAEKTRALRELLSAKHLSKLVPGKDTNGKILTEHIEVEGPIAYIESTTLSRIFDEDANRMIAYSIDETAKQTRHILLAQAKRRTGKVPPVATHIVNKHHAAQRLLAADTHCVLIPFAELLAKRFPAEQVEARRIFGHLLSLIEASTMLHSFQRSRHQGGPFLATLEDYTLAKKLLAKPLLRSLGGAMSEGAKRLYAQIREHKDLAFDEFTIPFVCTKLPVKYETVRQRVWELVDTNRAIVIEPSRGPKPAAFALVDEELIEESSIELPDADELEELLLASPPCRWISVTRCNFI